MKLYADMRLPTMYQHGGNEPGQYAPKAPDNHNCEQFNYSQLAGRKSIG